MICDGLLEDRIPTFTEPGCKGLDRQAIDLHKKQVWVRSRVNISEDLLNLNKPLGLFVSAKASSAFYLNGVFIGKNGKPARDAADEIIGMMDVVFYIPKQNLTAGQNELVFSMSSHQGYIRLANPIHRIAIAPYAAPSNIILNEYLPSFLPLGILVVGALYFGFLALRHRNDKPKLLIPFVALFAAGQLVTEVSRGALPYAYPFHDIRLMLILACAIASGFCLLWHVTSRFLEKYKWPVAGIAFALTLTLITLTPGFDNKSLYALQSPATFCALIAIYAAGEKKPKAAAYALVLLFFSLIIFLVPNQFLDVYFYYIVAGLLLFLFAEQIHILTEEKRLRATEQKRADRLQLILNESREKQSPSTVKVNQAGKVTLVPTDQIAFLKGARDYVELMVLDKGSQLHSETLLELEKKLPSTFLRVHRSYIVNTYYIQTLERDTSGSGSLLLSTGDKIPVSRRIMPTVRKALS